MRIKQIVCGLWVVGGLLGLASVGCSPKKTEIVVIRGSNTVGEELAPRLVAEYRKKHPSIAFDLEFKATSYGMATLMIGRCDLAAASREVSKTELELAKDRNVEFNDYAIGTYALAIIVNSANSIGNLSHNQVRDIFNGTIRNWKDVGGVDAPIHMYIRDPISGTYLGFQELALDKQAYGEGFKALTNYEAIVHAVASDVNGIGFSSIELATQAGIKGVSIEGVPPTIESVNQGKYGYSRVLRFYTNKANEKPSTRHFVDFVQSTDGQKILVEMGFVPRS